MADTTRLREVIEPEANALGFELVRVKLSGQGEERTLQVMAEDPATGQLVVEQCMALSRRISQAIDAIEEAGEELVRGTYNLEVSSPGIDRPLTREKDYVRWSGYAVRVETTQPIEGRRRFKGTLLGLENGAVRVKLDDGQEALVPLSQIIRAKLEMTDALLDEHRRAQEGAEQAH